MCANMSAKSISITATLSIREDSLEEKFIHAGGPGGQNVNKLATAVQLRFNISNSGLPIAVRRRLKAIAGSRLTRDGDIIITANRHRTQERNRADARARLVAMIAEAAKPPPPKRRPTRPSLAARKKRMDKKIRRGTLKKLRGAVRGDD